MAGVPGRSGGGNRKSPQDHQLRGTYRSDRHGPLPSGEPIEPIVQDDAPIPTGLKGAARKHWRYFAPLLQGARVLTPSDIETLADYCRTCAAVEDRDRRLTTVMRKRQIDWGLQGRLDRELRGWIERKTKLAGELGLTAISRTRVAWSGHGATIDPVKKPESKLAKLQAEAAALRRPLGVK